MLDLQFVRTNLELVEEKLRARGADPAAALGNFAALDRERRDAITQVETLKAQRNKLTDEIAKLRREGDGQELAGSDSAVGRLIVHHLCDVSIVGVHRIEGQLIADPEGDKDGNGGAGGETGEV